MRICVSHASDMLSQDVLRTGKKKWTRVSIVKVLSGYPALVYPVPKVRTRMLLHGREHDGSWKTSVCHYLYSS